MQRIVITGATGTGKTTLAGQLAKQIGGSRIDLDDFHWLPDWKERDRDEFKSLIEHAVAAERWTLSGNYTKMRDIIWPRADTVIWLDYPFWFVFLRLLRRSVLRIWDKNLICNGNTETLGKFLSSESIIVWLFKSFRKRKNGMQAALDNHNQWPHITFIRFKNPKDTEAWLQRFSPPSPLAP